MAKTVEELEVQRHSLTAQIRAARKSAAQADRRRLADAKIEFAGWVLERLFDDHHDAQVVPRLEATKSVLGQSAMTEYLREQLRPAVNPGSGASRGDPS